MWYSKLFCGGRNKLLVLAIAASIHGLIVLKLIGFELIRKLQSNNVVLSCVWQRLVYCAFVASIWLIEFIAIRCSLLHLMAIGEIELFVYALACISVAITVYQDYSLRHRFVAVEQTMETNSNFSRFISHELRSHIR